MKKKIMSLLALVLILSLTPTAFATNASPYTDVSTKDWYYPAVEYMSEQGYMTGYSATTFAPNDTLSRAMFVTILYRVSGEKADAKATQFTDVPGNTWYSEAVAWAVANGITSGTSATKFSPEDDVTREQMAVFLQRYIDGKNIRVSDDFIVTSVPKDMDEVSPWAKDAIEFAYKHGLLLEQYDGYRPAGYGVWPTSYAIRANAAIAFYNLLCVTKATDNALLLSKDYYNGSVGFSCNHSWANRHVDETGHYESIGTHIVRHLVCGCGNFELWSDDPDYDAKLTAHCHPLTGCNYGSTVWEVEKPNDPTYVVDIPAHDETYCTVCGVTQ